MATVQFCIVQMFVLNLRLIYLRVIYSIFYQYAPGSFTDTWSTLAQLQPELEGTGSRDRIQIFGHQLTVLVVNKYLS